ncbi:polysaccharide deacetylase family protein [Paludibaculum fermentans]|uniref:NodB homology domain-containing protein n=1 Tax=Paludibaculum fermentans TaxID=1473598 RepID=A0A7S7SIK3_PALFE|nr:hypothetical protein [Paludibaculum fermentans]QOY86184.1 hypothetical protein IRI77_25695 [Paludibaculum fermentans]
MRKLLILLLLAALGAQAATPPIYYLLWFDTEDYVEPAADDAALRIAQELTKRGIKATFKVVGEKARVLEQRNRTDVVAALKLHDIGYHSNYHSIHPASAEYMAGKGMMDGEQEFAMRELSGFQAVEKVFGMRPSCYGQPGNSWAPQANKILRQWGTRVYMDEGGQVGYEQQPFWYGSLLYIFGLGPNTMRANLDKPELLPDAYRAFDRAVDRLRATGGTIQTYYHPTEFVTTEFWDGVNLRRGANPERSEWKLPKRRTPESTEQAFKLFLAFVDHVQKTPGIKFITAREAVDVFQPREQSVPLEAARKLAENIDVHDGFSPADQVLALLGLPARHVDGPLRRVATTLKAQEISRPAFDRAKQDAVRAITQQGRLPDSVWIGSQELSLPDFAATLAGDTGTANVMVRKGQLTIESHIGTDAAKLYNWVIHPEGFAPENLLELARLQAWTLKPAKLR